MDLNQINQSSNEINPKQHISNFLRSLANDIDNDRLSTEKLFEITQFYISYQCDTEKNNYSNIETTDFSDEDFLKFLMLGWYIYCFLPKIE